MIEHARRMAYTGRLALSAWSGNPSFLPATPRPLLISVNLTDNCQARCRLCNYWQEQKDDAISTARAIQLAAEAAVRGFRYVRWAGGEPLLREDLFEILRSIPPRTFSKIILGTNGRELPRFIEEINASCLTNISVSLDGYGETNRKLRGVDFEPVRAALGGIVGKRIKISSLLTKHLAPDIETLMDWCGEQGYDYDIVLPSGVLPYSNTDEISANLDEMWPSAAEVDTILTAMLKRRLTTTGVAGDARAYMVDRQYSFRRCMNGYTEVRITANGDVYAPCPLLPPVGNIVQQSLHEALATEPAATHARKGFDLDCPLCLLGWQTSQVFEHPTRNVPYVLKRLQTR